MMKEFRPTIEAHYSAYLEKYPEFGLLRDADYDFPLQGSVLKGVDPGSVARNQNELERACLVELRKDIPNVANLPMKDLTWLPVGLTDTLKVQLTHDHYALWEYTGELLLQMNSGGSPFIDGLVSNCETAYRCMLYFHTEFPPRGVDEWGTEYNRNHILQESSRLARYLIFPTVEGMLKSLSRRDIKQDGEVRDGRQVARYPEDRAPYGPGEEVNNLGHLLYHLENEVAVQPLNDYLEEFRDKVWDFFKLNDEDEIDGVYGFLADQRNSVLHGEYRALAESGIMLNLLSLLILNIDNIPEERRKLPDN